MSLALELSGDSAAAVDEATSTLLEQLSKAGVDIAPAQSSGERDGGIIALLITILGGVASVAQVASTIHSISQRKNVQVIVVDSSGARTQINPTDSPDTVKALIDRPGGS